MTREELVKLLIREFGDEYGNINLSYLNFGERDVNLEHMKAAKLVFKEAKAETIDNSRQIATNIDNENQRAGGYIRNNDQIGHGILNYRQSADFIKNWEQEAKKNIQNYSQTAEISINNEDQKSGKIFN